MRTLELTTGDTENVTGYGPSNSFVFNSVTAGHMLNLTTIGTKVNNVGMGNENIISTKTNLEGEIIWEKIFGGSKLSLSYGYRICIAHDYGYVLSGTSASADGLAYVYIIKIDENGSVVSTNSFPFLPEITVFPNPCSQVLNVQLGAFETEKRITVFNNVGQEVYHLNTLVKEIQLTEVALWPAGVYMVHVEVDGHKVARIIVVE